jgi:hypothetical protein
MHQLLHLSGRLNSAVRRIWQQQDLEGLLLQQEGQYLVRHLHQYQLLLALRLDSLAVHLRLQQLVLVPHLGNLELQVPAHLVLHQRRHRSETPHLSRDSITLEVRHKELREVLVEDHPPRPHLVHHQDLVEAGLGSNNHRKLEDLAEEGSQELQEPQEMVDFNLELATHRAHHVVVDVL